MGFFVFVLVSVAQRLSNVYGDQALQIFFGIALSYLLMTVPLGQLVDNVELAGNEVADRCRLSHGHSLRPSISEAAESLPHRIG